MHKKFVCILVVLSMAGASANAQVQLNEIVGSTSGTDWEFIELKNVGASPVDISGWTIELWDSDFGSTGWGLADDGSPFVIPAATSIAAGSYYTMGNLLGQTGWGYTADLTLSDNSIENGSYTMILTDALLNPVDSLFMTDGGAGDAANRNGAAFVPNASFGPDGSYLPAGAYLWNDLGPWSLNDFSVPGTTATPGAQNIPEPTTLALFGFGALLMARRRR